MSLSLVLVDLRMISFSLAQEYRMRMFLLIGLLVTIGY